eukprot:1110590-Rhodomonas_salina.1
MPRCNSISEAGAGFKSVLPDFEQIVSRFREKLRTLPISTSSCDLRFELLHSEHRSSCCFDLRNHGIWDFWVKEEERKEKLCTEEEKLNGKVELTGCEVTEWERRLQ